ncbi:MAG TPA: glycoside hydrolase family 3 N-terminal domain-containing protein [Candidatus Dojkabacteria bacterium]|nr:glycoside hydrolase family 3 N-terminal domain-containing protein [Candidatus Dojkabacteria bacterium]
MRKIYKIFLTAIFLLILLILLPPPKNNNLIYDIQGDIQIKKTPPLEERILSQMTVEEKIGQLLLFGFSGTSLNADIQNLIETKYIGGVLLLGKNIQNMQQLKKLNNDLQSISQLPLFIAVDQEGGSVARIQESSKTNISQRYLQGEKQICDISVQRAKMLKELGINMNLAPVAEYITNNSSFMYERTFSGSRQEVAQKVYSAVKGYVDSKMISTVKHFPGHDNQSKDTHSTIAQVNISPQQWDEYIYTFKYPIDKGIVDVIMVGHIKFPKIDDKPATVSKVIIDGKLRKEIGYEGVVITDDMQMSSIWKYAQYCNTAKEALLAGNDILLYSQYTPRATLLTDVYNCILNAITSGEIAENVIDQKVLRILKLKIKYGLIDESILPLQAQ